MTGKKYKFLLSRISPEEKTFLIPMIVSLHGSFSMATREYDPEATHVVVSKFVINEQTLGAMAAGKWILHKAFIEHSFVHSKWKQESKYEMRIPINKLKSASAKQFALFTAPRRCREMVLVKCKPYFSDWKVGIFSKNENLRICVKRILLAGGADVIDLSLPITEVWEIAKKRLNFVVTDLSYEVCKPLIDVGISCVLPTYVMKYLLQDPAPSINQYKIKDRRFELHELFLRSCILTEKSRLAYKPELRLTTTSSISEVGAKDVASKEGLTGIQEADKEIGRNLSPSPINGSRKEINSNDGILQVIKDAANVNEESKLPNKEQDMVKRKTTVMSETNKNNNYINSSNKTAYTHDEEKFSTITEKNNGSNTRRPDVEVYDEDVIYLSDDSEANCEEYVTDLKKAADDVVKWDDEDDSCDSDISFVCCVVQSKTEVKNEEESSFSTAQKKTVYNIGESCCVTDDDDVTFLSNKGKFCDNAKPNFNTVRKKDANITKCQSFTVDEVTLDDSCTDNKLNVIDLRNEEMNSDSHDDDSVKKEKTNVHLTKHHNFTLDDVILVDDSNINCKQNVSKTEANLSNYDKPKFSDVRKEEADHGSIKCQCFPTDNEVTLMYDTHMKNVKDLKNEEVNLGSHDEPNFNNIRKEEATDNFTKFKHFPIDDEVILIDESSSSCEQNVVYPRNEEGDLRDHDKPNVRKEEATDNFTKFKHFPIDDEVTLIDESSSSCEQNVVYPRNEEGDLKDHDKPNVRKEEATDNFTKFKQFPIDDEVTLIDESSSSCEQNVVYPRNEEGDLRDHDKPNVRKEEATDNFTKFKQFPIDDEVTLIDESSSSCEQNVVYPRNEEGDLRDHDKPNVRKEEATDNFTKFKHFPIDDEVTLIDESSSSCEQNVVYPRNEEVDLRDHEKPNVRKEEANDNITKHFTNDDYDDDATILGVDSCITSNKNLGDSANKINLTDNGKLMFSTFKKQRNNGSSKIHCTITIDDDDDVGVQQSVGANDQSSFAPLNLSSSSQQSVTNSENSRVGESGCELEVQNHPNVAENSGKVLTADDSTSFSSKNDYFAPSISLSVSTHTTSVIKQCIDHKDAASQVHVSDIEQTTPTERSDTNNTCTRKRKGRAVLKQSNTSCKPKIRKTDTVVQQSQDKLEDLRAKNRACEIIIENDTNFAENPGRFLTGDGSTPYCSKEKFASMISLPVSSHPTSNMVIKQCMNHKNATSENSDLTTIEQTTSTKRNSTSNECSRKTKRKCEPVSKQSNPSSESRITRTSTVPQQSQAEHIQQSDADPLEIAIKIAFYSYFDCPAERLNLEWSSPCTANPFSCPHNHKIFGKELTDAHSKMLKSLIKMKHFNSALWYCNELVTQHHYPHTYTFFGFLSLILNTHESRYLGSASAVFRRMITVHPPCAPGMRCYYRSILMDPMEDFIGETRNGFMLEIMNRLAELMSEENVVTADADKENIIHSSENSTGVETFEVHKTEDYTAVSIHEKIRKCLALIGGGSLSDENNLEELLQTNLYGPRDEVLETEEECLDYANLSRKDKLQRVLKVGDLLVDLMERDLAVLLVKDTMELKKALRIKSCQPLIVTVLWKSETSAQIGRLNAVCRNLIDLYVQGIRLKLQSNMPPLIMRILALVAEVAFVIDFRKEYPYPYFGTYCQNLAQEIGIRVLQLNSDDVSTAVSMIKPTWLQLLVAHFLTTQVMHEEPFKRIKLEAVISWLQIQRPPVIDIEHMDEDEYEAEEPPSAQSRMRSAQINKRDAKGETRLHRVCRSGKVNELRKLLQDPDINVNVVDNCGWTPLHEAVWYNRLECVQLLLDYVPPSGGSLVDINAVSDTGVTPFMDAVEKNHLDMAKLLLQYGGSTLLDVKSSTDEQIIFHMAGTVEMKELLRKAASERPTGIRNTEAYKKPLPDLAIKLIPYLIDSYMATYRILPIMTGSQGASQDIHLHRENKMKLQFDLTAYNKDIEHLEELYSLLKKLKGTVPEYRHTHKLLDFFFATKQRTMVNAAACTSHQ